MHKTIKDSLKTQWAAAFPSLPPGEWLGSQKPFEKNRKAILNRRRTRAFRLPMPDPSMGTGILASVQAAQANE